MFIWTAHLRKKKALVVALAILAVAVMVAGGLLSRSGGEEAVRLETAQDRVDYLTGLGWEISPEPVATLQLQLPNPLTKPYVTYNKLQKEQGFDLEELAGQQVTRYTYLVLNYPDHPSGVQVNLYLRQGVPAAGDVIVTGADGFQAGLAYPK